MGSRHLTSQTVARIRRLYKRGDKICHIAEHYGLTRYRVGLIVNNKTYKSVQDDAADHDRLLIRGDPIKPALDKIEATAARLAEGILNR